MEKIKVFVAADHGGFEKKQKFIELFGNQYDIIDKGAFSFDADDDYPDFIISAAQAVAQTSGSLGIVFGGSGQGECIAANKVVGIRCGLFNALATPQEAIDKDGTLSNNPYVILELLKQHNNANMLSIGGRLLTDEQIMEAIRVFLETPYIPVERHGRRIEKITQFEQQKS